MSISLCNDKSTAAITKQITPITSINQEPITTPIVCAGL